MPNESDKPRTRKPHLRKPDATDGAAIWELVKSCKPLDENSMYCNLVQTDHFRDTCVVAELDGDIVGWISGYMIPDRDELFVWQVAVSPQARGLGLGREMLRSLTERSACAAATQGTEMLGIGIITKKIASAVAQHSLFFVKNKWHLVAPEARRSKEANYTFCQAS